MHRDIKPDNFLIGTGKNANTIYVIDFGLAKHYKDPKTNMHIPYKDKKNLTGTARYASLSTHLGIEQSRRDDLEGLGYVLLYFLKGSLPWQGLQAKNRKEKYEKIKEKKQAIPIEKLCEELPYEFGMYIKYCRELKFDEDPNYIHLRGIFEILFKERKYVMDFMFDWKLFKEQKKHSDNAAIKLMLKSEVPEGKDKEEKQSTLTKFTIENWLLENKTTLDEAPIGLTQDYTFHHIPPIFT